MVAFGEENTMANVLNQEEYRKGEMKETITEEKNK